MKKKVQYIQDVKDAKGYTHSLLVYGKNEIYWGNKRFPSMREAKAAIQPPRSAGAKEDGMQRIIDGKRYKVRKRLGGVGGYFVRKDGVYWQYFGPRFETKANVLDYIAKCVIKGGRVW